MDARFSIDRGNGWVRVQVNGSTGLANIRFFVDGEYAASFHRGHDFYIIKSAAKPTYSNMIAEERDQRSIFYEHRFNDEMITHHPGDVLVASDNTFMKITGVVGHAAIVVDQHHLVESRGGTPAIVKDSIQQFKEKHPEHAVFRPKSNKTGNAAAQYARKYEMEYRKRMYEGSPSPTYSVTLTQDLTDPWEYIYCSKLVWLAYYYGANKEIENDFLWMSPEDLYTKLSENDDFLTVYEDEGVGFILNT